MDKKNGIGIYRKDNGFSYRGMFTDDAPNGNGEVTSSRIRERSRSKSKDKCQKEGLKGSTATVKKPSMLRQTIELKSAQLTRQPEPSLIRKSS